MTSLILKRASASRPDGQWKDEDYDVFADGKVVGRIYEDATSARRRSLDGSWSITNKKVRAAVTAGRFLRPVG
jgi:hypothetical protein